MPQDSFKAAVVGEHVLFPYGNILSHSKAYDIKYSRTVT